MFLLIGTCESQKQGAQLRFRKNGRCYICRKGSKEKEEVGRSEIWIVRVETIPLAGRDISGETGAFVISPFYRVQCEG